MSKNSNLKRVRNVFEGFSFQDDASPVNKDESEPSNKFQRMSSNHTVQSLLESVSRKNSEESPWLETRAASRMDSHEKAKNIAVAIEQRKKTGKPDMTVFSRIPTKGFGLEDVTRLSEEDETAKKKTDLSRILSKSNLIRTSLLNQSVDDLEDYDPVSTFREKIQENRVIERMQRKDLRVNSSSSEFGNRRNRIILDSDEEDEEESRFSNNNGFNHKAEFQRKQTDESAFGEETPQELERTKKLSKLTKNNKQSAAVSLLDSDEEVQPKKSSKTKKNKKELTKKVVLVDSDEEQDDGRQNNSDEEEEESTNWRDMSKADIKQKALEIIDKCKGLSKNLRSSLQRWEGRKSDDGKSNDCINLIEIKDVSATTNENSSSADGSSLIKVSDIQILCPDLTLNSYQLVGVNWLKLLYENQMNGVLADDMGLGKTIQTIAFLTYLSKSKQNSCKLPHFIVVPASTLANWENEFHKFAPSMTLIKYHGSQQERQDLRQEIKDMIRHGELDVILSTYTMFERESNKLDRGFIQSLKFNFLVLDEAHSIKNSDSSRYYHLNNLETRYRLLLSGTPVQNNLMELLALLSFLMPNLFLKEHCQILMEVFNWSLGSGERNREGGFNSKEEMKALMDLKSILSPFVLRRLKSDVLNQLSEKRYVLQKIPMNEYQATVYNNIISQYLQKKETDKANFLETLESKDPEKQKGKGRGRKKKDDDDSKKNGLASTNSGVIDLSESPVKSANAPQNVIKGGITATEAKHLFTSLRKAANHPLLLRIHYTTEKVKKIGKIAFQQEYFGKQCNLQQVMNELENNFSDYDLHELCLQFPQYLSNEILDESTLYQSPKMNYLSTLLPQLIQEDHRILLFSQWTRLLDLLEILLNALDLKFLRLDGSTPIKERQRLIDEYSGDSTISVFLLSTKAGGLGINLTAADTVILHDLDFNPENDKQAEDRCYRIGQTKPVTIYKLVTEGTVDEDIYEMGERKSQLSQAVLSNRNNNGESKQQDKEEDVNLISQILAKALNRK